MSNPTRVWPCRGWVNGYEKWLSENCLSTGTWMNNDKKKILIIDDEELVRGLLSELFLSEDFEVYTAEEGGTGMKIIETTPVDLLITDLIMPGKEGIETIHAARDARPQMKIIAMSGASRYLNLAKPFGIDAVIQKPFRNQEVLDLARSVLGLSKK